MKKEISSKTRRQNECVRKWIANNGNGTIVATTGFGKTRIALMIMKMIHDKQPDVGFLVVVTSDVLKNQWRDQIEKTDRTLVEVSRVETVETVVRNTWTTCVLILDEIHRYASEIFSTIFLKVKYTFILGLTATFTRLDRRDKLLSLYCPVIDTIKDNEALKNGWISPFMNYEVILDVPDIQEYKDMTAEFYGHFDYFGYDFPLVMSFIGKNGYRKQAEYVRRMIPRGPIGKQQAMLTEVKNHTMGFMRAMAKRKRFIYNHPMKIDVDAMITEARKDKKIITFSASTKMALSLKHGTPLIGKMTPLQTKTKIDMFNKEDFGILNTCRKVNEGMDIRGLSVAIIMNTDSSKINSIQKAGRVIRFEEGKIAEIFTLVINGTSEMTWYENSHKKGSYIQIDLEGLKNILAGRPYNEYEKPVRKMNFTF